jgi:N6-adenosine-specific RNA methylase IME4
MGDYRVILADPPWLCNDAPPRNAASRYYRCLPTEAIERLPVSGLAAKDAMLCMWVTMSHLPVAERVMQAWGFEYVGCLFAWVKIAANGQPSFGVGNYTRLNAELCLLGRRGRGVKCKAHNVGQIMMARRRRHSRKPDEQYDRIMRLFDGPYLELFARQQWPGWDVWGNEAGKFPAQPFLIPEQMGVAS